MNLTPSTCFDDQRKPDYGRRVAYMRHQSDRQILESVLQILELQVLQSTLYILILFKGIKRVGEELLQTDR